MPRVTEMKGRAKPGPLRRRARASKASPARAGQVQSLSRALSIVNALARDDDGLTLTDLAHTVGLPPSTVHRLLTTLEEERFVRFDREISRWVVGVQAFIVGSAFLRSREVVALARPFLRQLMEESGETANLAFEDEGEAVYMGQVESRQLVRAIAKPGGRVLMHGSAIGKAMLAAMPASAIGAILQRHGLPRLTEHTIDTPARLRLHLEEIRARGYAIDDEEYVLGMRCVAAPIYDEHGGVAAAISLSGPTARVTADRLAMLGGLVRKVAGQLTAEFGGRAQALKAG
jgi:IclR family transcriptional regulator, acetate operon repressor